MSAKNRAEIISEVGTKIIATVTNTIHRDLLDNDIINSLDIRKDVKNTSVPAGGTVTVDFASTDLRIVETTGNLVITIGGLEDGDNSKYIYVTKNLANTIAFAGATDVSARKLFINTNVTVVIYKITNKNNVVTVESVNIDNDFQDSLARKLIQIGTWNMQSGPDPAVEMGMPGAQVLGFNVIIEDDSTPGVRFMLSTENNTVGGGWGFVGPVSTKLSLRRVSGGVFDTASYSDGVKNRGYIILDYLL